MIWKGKVYRIRRKIRLRLLALFERRKIKNLSQKLSNDFKHVLENYKISALPITDHSIKPVVWFMWWQGEDSMPDIIRINYNALQHNLNGYEIIFLDKTNIEQYLTLPQYIWKKLESGLISITHLSDLVRASVLHKYGGLWLDATIHVTAPLPNYKGLTYWSPKWQIKQSEKRKYKLWFGLWSISNIPKLTMTQCMGTWYSAKDNPIFGCLKDFWLAYWKDSNGKPYYWTTEVFLIGCMYPKIPAVQNQIDNLGYNNPKVFNISELINEEVNHKALRELLSDTQYFYLRWKSQYIENSTSNKKTLYYHLTQDALYLSKLKGSFY